MGEGEATAAAGVVSEAGSAAEVGGEAAAAGLLGAVVLGGAGGAGPPLSGGAGGALAAEGRGAVPYRVVPEIILVGIACMYDPRGSWYNPSLIGICM